MFNAQPSAQAQALHETPIQAALDGVLEPSDLTIAQVQSFVVMSRQLDCHMDYASLVMAASENLRRLCEHPCREYAVAVAALSLRIAEEHLT